MLISIFLQRQRCLLSPGSMAGDGKSRKWDEWRYQQILPLFCQRRKSKAFSEAASVKVPGHRQSWGRLGFGVFVSFPFPVKHFIKSIFRLPWVPKLPTNLLTHFHQKNSYFYTRHSLKKKKALKNQNRIYFSPPPVCPVNWKKSIICSYSATGLRNPTEHLWSWHFSLTSSSVQDPWFQWHLPVSALTRNTYTTTARENYLPSWAVSINNSSYPLKCHVWPSLQKGLVREEDRGINITLLAYAKETLSAQLS